MGRVSMEVRTKHKIFVTVFGVITIAFSFLYLAGVSAGRPKEELIEIALLGYMLGCGVIFLHYRTTKNPKLRAFLGLAVILGLGWGAAILYPLLKK
jgi:hypothetical protein